MYTNETDRCALAKTSIESRRRRDHSAQSIAPSGVVTLSEHNIALCSTLKQVVLAPDRQGHRLRHQSCPPSSGRSITHSNSLWPLRHPAAVQVPVVSELNSVADICDHTAAGREEKRREPRPLTAIFNTGPGTYASMYTKHVADKSATIIVRFQARSESIQG